MQRASATMTAEMSFMSFASMPIWSTMARMRKYTIEPTTAAVRRLPKERSLPGVRRPSTSPITMAARPITMAPVPMPISA